MAKLCMGSRIGVQGRLQGPPLMLREPSSWLPMLHQIRHKKRPLLLPPPSFLLQQAFNFMSYPE